VKKGCVITAAAITGAYLALRLTGQVRYVSVLSGTLPEGGEAGFAGMRAAMYVALHLGFVVLVPTLLLAAALDFLVDRVLASRPPTRER
jgi:hypothetical protein